MPLHTAPPSSLLLLLLSMLSSFLILTLLLSGISAVAAASSSSTSTSTSTTQTLPHRRSCIYPRFQRTDFFIQGLTYLPTELSRKALYSSLGQSRSDRLVPPFPEMLGKLLPQEVYLEKINERVREVYGRIGEPASAQKGTFSYAFLHPQSLYGHAFPDEHKEVFFFPFCCEFPKEKPTEEEIQAEIETLIEEGFFEHWWNEVSYDTLEKLYYEYSVFGVCSEGQTSAPTPREYFQMAKNLFHTLRLEELLFEKALVKPGLRKVHTVSHVRNAIREVVDAQMVFQCLWDEKLQKNLLQQVWMCYDKNLKLIDCPLQLQEEETCTRQAKGLGGSNIELVDFYIPTWEDMLQSDTSKDEL